MTQNQVKGFKVEFKSVYDQLSIEDKLNYMWFVREDENQNTGKIYFGSRLYSGNATTEQFEYLKVELNALDKKIDAVNIRVDAEDTRINATNDRIDVINEKIDVVKEQSTVIYQKIDDIYADSNKVREDVDILTTIVSDTVSKVETLDIKIDGEIERASGVETILQNNITNLVKKDVELDENKVSYLSKDDKRIVLENHKNLLGTSTENNTYNIGMVSKWDVVDLGTTHLPLNFNSSEVPTVQLFGQTGEQAKHIAFSEDVSLNVNEMKELVNLEAIRATDAENSLQININDNRNALEAVQKSINEALITEIDRATAAEATNANTIVLETARATNTETNLQTNINQVSNTLTNITETFNNNFTNLVNKDAELETAINTKVENVELVQDAVNQLHYTLMVDDVAAGDINIPADQFLKDVTFSKTTGILTFTFETSSGEKVVKVDLSKLIDIYTAGNGLDLSENGVFSIKVDPNTQKYIEVTTNGIKLIGIDELNASDIVLQTNIDNEVTRAKAAEVVNTNAITALTTDLATEVTRAKAAETLNTNNITALNTNLTTEVTRAKGAEVANANAITGLTTDLTNEVTRAKAAEVVNANAITGLTTNLTAEVTRAKAAEVVNANAVTALTAVYEAKVLELTNAITALTTRVQTLENKAVIISSDVTSIVQVTQVQYDAIVNKDPKVLYIIID